MGCSFAVGHFEESHDFDGSGEHGHLFWDAKAR